MSNRRFAWFAGMAALIMALPAQAGQRLPDGGTAKARGSGVVSAHYEDPTTRYAHAILGDAIEAGTLVAKDAAGKTHRIVLPDSEVFEDITPRLADLNGDGAAEIITIRTKLSAGSALAVYGLKNGELVEYDATAPIGRSNRWLCPADIADYDGDGRLEVPIVKTPHIGGTLEFWELRGTSLKRQASASGYSNHYIGSRNLAEATSGDIDGDGKTDLVLPDAGRTSLIAVSLKGGEINKIGTAKLKGRVVGSIRLRGSKASVATSAGNQTVSLTGQ